MRRRKAVRLLLPSSVLVVSLVLSANMALGQSATNSGAGTSTTKKHRQSDDDDAIFKEELSSDGLDDPAPKPEYPYPGASEEGFTAKTPAPQTRSSQQSNGSVKARPLPTQAPNPGLPRPKQITEDGDYIYDTSPQPVKPLARPGVAPPKKTDAEGQFYYPDPTTPKFSGRKGVEKPLTISPSGEYTYGVPHPVNHVASSFRVGAMTPPTIVNPVNGATYTEIYGKGPVPILMGDYEWHLTSKVGRFDLKFTSGFTVSSGTGRFATPRPNNVLPIEKYTFLMMPNQFTAVYRFQYANDQFFVPFIEGGGGYFTFIELRDDNKGTKGGGSPVAVAAGGASLLLNAFDKQAVIRLESEYGITHIWFTAEYRQFLGLEKSTNFTSEVIDLGFMVEY